MAACSSSQEDSDGDSSTTASAESAESAESSGSTDASGTAPGASTSAAPSGTAEDDASCPVPEDLAQLAGSSLAVGIHGFDDAAAAVDAGVRHIFIGSSTDQSILDGQGDPERSISALKDRARAANEANGGGAELAVSVDEEGGQVQRLSEVIGEVPSAQQLADTMQPDQVTDLFAEHGRKMAELGITQDFAPVVDLAGGEQISDNAIGDRSFSDDPAVVSEYAAAAARGLQQSGITPVIKHFPGHGHATGDSHLGTVTTPPIDQMDADLQPFADLLGDTESDGPGIVVMVGHMQTPGLDGPDAPGESTPASLNPAAYEMLRSGVQDGEGYDGVIFTDDLTGMAAITDLHSGPEAVAAALRAGADAPLTSTDANVQATVDAVVDAVNDGSLDRERLEEASARQCALN
ncbi:MAG TPA: glycoside hydrolase family 3 protein [Candidatus Corynebacterium avicola]|uniref:beta-N-acetylhexosaminidase n=1 Tax=Candidatus Corynebacterium avicola TaxID=2838527 RepID=A0A9D1RNV9_9CORY|nr:glycoside hydrolase family 3 protein [Candidatus Corynebacterium avicola]